MAVNWTLSMCCGTEEIIFLVLFGSYFVINLLLWKTFILKPMKLMAVFVHEMGHATMCWLTGGKVNEINVETNEGGVTKYQGGNRCCIIPAGYLGGAFVGGLLVTLSGNRIAATISASIFVCAMLGSLCFKPNFWLVVLNLFFSAVTIGFILIDWLVYDPLVQFVTLYYGVFIGSFSVYDIYDDLITRTVEGSDAHACHQLIPCCLPRCVGVQWAIVAIAFQGLGMYLALVWFTST